MANERDDEQFGQDKQPFGQQDQKSEFGQNQGQSSSGQADPGNSGDTATLTPNDPTGGQSQGGSSNSQQGGFVGSQSGGSDEQVQDDSATEGSDFASQSQGALDSDDIETGQSHSDNDIEGGTGA
ncbi:MAG: hypothetical protein ABIO69_01950 [Sphingomicrobium sp.]